MGVLTLIPTRAVCFVPKKILFLASILLFIHFVSSITTQTRQALQPSNRSFLLRFVHTRFFLTVEQTYAVLPRLQP